MSPKLLVYGATGLAGVHIVRTAFGSGLQTILHSRHRHDLDDLHPRARHHLKMGVILAE